MRHIISVLMENEPGALSRVVGLFSQRNYNIDSLTVAPTEGVGRPFGDRKPDLGDLLGNITPRRDRGPEVLVAEVIESLGQCREQ